MELGLYLLHAKVHHASPLTVKPQGRAWWSAGVYEDTAAISAPLLMDRASLFQGPVTDGVGRSLSLFLTLLVCVALEKSHNLSQLFLSCRERTNPFFCPDVTHYCNAKGLWCEPGWIFINSTQSRSEGSKKSQQKLQKSSHSLFIK